jgi:hypothetical protein
MGFLEIRNPPEVFNACALRFVSVILHMVVQITETPSVNVAAQDTIYSKFFARRFGTFCRLVSL